MKLGNVPRLSEREKEIMSAAGRYVIVMRMIGMRSRTIAICRLFLIVPGVWSISAMAQTMRLNRDTIRSSLLDGERIGMCKRVKGGWIITPKGEATFTAIHREAVEICAGERQGFSRELLDYVRAGDVGEVDEAASTISFKPNNFLKSRNR